MPTAVIFSSRNRRLAGFLALLGWVSASAPALGSSLAPASVQAMAGNWLLFADGERGQGCTLVLEGDGQATGGVSPCGAEWLGVAITGWASKPDGLSLNRADRALIVLNPAGEGHFRGRAKQGMVLWLERVD